MGNEHPHHFLTFFGFTAIGTIVLGTIGSTVVLELYFPEKNNLPVIGVIIAFVTPVLVSIQLLLSRVSELDAKVNSRLDLLMKLASQIAVKEYKEEEKRVRRKMHWWNRLLNSESEEK